MTGMTQSARHGAHNARAHGAQDEEDLRPLLRGFSALLARGQTAGRCHLDGILIAFSDSLHDFVVRRALLDGSH